MSKPYKDTKSFYPGAGFNGGVGKKRVATPGFKAPADQEAPQRLGDSDNLRGAKYDGTIPATGWLRGGDSTRKPGFQKTKV